MKSGVSKECPKVTQLPPQTSEPKEKVSCSPSPSPSPTPSSGIAPATAPMDQKKFVEAALKMIAEDMLPLR